MIVKRQLLNKESYKNKSRYILEESLSYKKDPNQQYFIQRINSLIRFINTKLEKYIIDEDYYIEDINELINILRDKFNNKEDVLNLYTRGSGQFQVFEYNNNDLKILINDERDIKLYIIIYRNNRPDYYINKMLTRLHCYPEYIEDLEIDSLFDNINVNKL